MRRTAIILCALACATAAVAQEAADAPAADATPSPEAAGDPAQAQAQSLADAWCRAVVAFDETAAVTMMSPDLQQEVVDARAASDAYAAAHPGEKPPLGDGLPLTGFADRPESCTASEVTAAGALVTLTAAGATPASWTDGVEFAPGPGGQLVVEDVLYAPERTVRMSDAMIAMAETGE